MTSTAVRWDPARHPRVPHGSGGGRFTTAKGSLPFSVSGDTATYHGHMGVNRADMPQLSGLDAGGVYHPSAEMVPKFMDHLKGQGISVKRTRIDPAELRPTQTTGDTGAIRRIADSLKSGALDDTKPITVSMDGRVLDGHHNWAAKAVANAEGGRPGLSPGQQVVQVGLPMKQLLAHARQFAADQGIASRGAGEFANPEHAGKHPPVQSAQPRKVTHLGSRDPARVHAATGEANQLLGAQGQSSARAFEAAQAGSMLLGSSRSQVSRGGHWLHNWVPLDAEALKEKHHGHVPPGARVGQTKAPPGKLDIPAGQTPVWDVGAGKMRLVLTAEAAAGHQRFGQQAFRPGSPARGVVDEQAMNLAREASGGNAPHYMRTTTTGGGEHYHVVHDPALYGKARAHFAEVGAGPHEGDKPPLEAMPKPVRKFYDHALANGWDVSYSPAHDQAGLEGLHGIRASNPRTHQVIGQAWDKAGKHYTRNRPEPVAKSMAAIAAHPVRSPTVAARAQGHVGLTWDGAELLLRADVARELRVPGGPRGGQWTKSPVAGLIPGGGESIGGGPRPAAAAAGPSTAELASMVDDLHKQFAEATGQLEQRHREEMHATLADLRKEQAHLVELAQRRTEVTAAREEHRKEVVRAVATILGLVAVAALILATAGAALPPIAAAGVAVGPLIGAETVTFLHHTATEGKKARASALAPG